MSSRFQFADGRLLSAQAFNQLATVLQAFVAETSSAIAIAADALPGAIALTEACLPGFGFVIRQGIHRFVVVQSAQFSGLLLGQAVRQVTSMPAGEATTIAPEKFLHQSQEEQYCTLLEFDPAAIADFLTVLAQEFASDDPLHSRVQQAIADLRPNPPHRQAEFSLRLAEMLYSAPPVALPPSPKPQQSPLPQSESNTVFNEVTSQIRQTYELSFILQTAIQQVRHFLQVDRVLIYELDSIVYPVEASTPPRDLAPDLANAWATGVPPGMTMVCGRVTYEDRAHPSVPQILNLSEGMQCFIGVPDYREKFRKGAVQAIADVQVAYAHAPCLVSLLTWAHVQSEVIVPIVCQEKLWGLLIAHQCSRSRTWQDSEVQFLQYMAELLAIAIYQNQLYTQLQQQAQTLEQRVIERTQELRDAVNAAQSATISKAEFLATVSHELRTPLTAIIGMATTLLRLPTDERREKLLPLVKQQEYLQIIRNSGEHLLDLINSMIDLSQVEAGRTILEPQEFGLYHLATECIQMLRDKAQQNQIKLHLDFQVDPDRDRFIADTMRLRQILINLLTNAIKFTPAGGKVILRVWREGDFAVFQVEDTGIGIPDHQFPLLFKKFQQLDRTYQRQYEGTGLGLALTQQLVELHNGKIDVESTVNAGSTFTVQIPLQLLKPAPSMAKYPATPSTGGQVVLVEPDEMTATVICDLLTAAGHQVIWLMEGMTALRQIEIILPEVVLVDTRLTGMSPREFVARLRQQPDTVNTQVLILHHQAANYASHLPSPFDDAATVIALPLQDPEELLEQVQTLVDRQGVGDRKS